MITNSFDSLTLSYISFDELKEHIADFPFARQTLTVCESNAQHIRNGIDIYERYSFGLLTLLCPNDIHGVRDKIAFYLQSDLFLLVSIHDTDHSTQNIYDQMITHFSKSSVTLERAVFYFFDHVIAEDNEHIEKMEKRLNKLEDSLINSNINPDFNHNLYHLKKELHLLRNYYEQLIDIGQDMIADTNDLFEDKALPYLHHFTNKATRLRSNVQDRLEDLIHIREAYESALNYSLNQIMKVFTVVTSVFLPLTLLVGWYGMNFTTMPELTWKYGYVFVIVLSIVILVYCLTLFKRKGWM
ncbi:MAG: CorA family divalent cation transporter [Lachnospiraceae bacterium]